MLTVTANTFAGGRDTAGIAFDTASSKMWMVDAFDSTVDVFDAPSGTFFAVYTTGGSMDSATNIVYSPTGASMWVTLANEDSVVELATADGSIIGTFGVGSAPIGVCVDPSGNVWVTNAGDGTVTELAPDGSTIGTFPVGHTPVGILAEGPNIWVSNSADDTVMKLDGATGAQLATVAVGDGPEAMCFDGTNVWVANLLDASVTKIDASTAAVVGTFFGVGNADGIAFDGTYIWFCSAIGGNVNIFLASDGTYEGAFSSGVSDGASSLAYDGANMWQTNGPNGPTQSFSIMLLTSTPVPGANRFYGTFVGFGTSGQIGGSK